MKKLLTVLLVIMAITNFLIPSNVLAARQTIVIDGALQQEWTTVGTTLSDLAGDVSGAGPHDLVKFSTTNDDTYIYARWDAVASYTDVKSLAYGIALTSVMPSGGAIPTAEVIAYVEYDNKQDVIVALENSSKEVVTIESGVTISTSVYAQVEEYTVGSFFIIPPNHFTYAMLCEMLEDFKGVNPDDFVNIEKYALLSIQIDQQNDYDTASYIETCIPLTDEMYYYWLSAAETQPESFD